MAQYHKAALPEGMVVVGDAAMSLNPVSPKCQWVKC